MRTTTMNGSSDVSLWVLKCQRSGDPGGPACWCSPRHSPHSMCRRARRGTCTSCVRVDMNDHPRPAFSLRESEVGGSGPLLSSPSTERRRGQHPTIQQCRQMTRCQKERRLHAKTSLYLEPRFNTKCVPAVRHW